MATWSRFFPDVLVHVSQCPQPIVLHELRRAAQDFFERSRAWRVKLDPIAVGAGDGEVAIETDDPDEHELVRAEAAWYDGKPLKLKTVEELDAENGADWQAFAGEPVSYTQLVPGSVILFPVPVDAAVIGLSVRVSIKPADSATGIPDDLYVKFREPLTNGAKSRLMRYKDKPWTDYNLSDAFATVFEDSIASARVAAVKAFGAARIASRPKWC